MGWKMICHQMHPPLEPNYHSWTAATTVPSATSVTWTIGEEQDVCTGAEVCSGNRLVDTAELNRVLTSSVGCKHCARTMQKKTIDALIEFTQAKVNVIISSCCSLSHRDEEKLKRISASKFFEEWKEISQNENNIVSPVHFTDLQTHCMGRHQ
jgi:hypothetical protein